MALNGRNRIMIGVQFVTNTGGSTTVASRCCW
jgi:hypothetical protein